MSKLVARLMPLVTVLTTFVVSTACMTTESRQSAAAIETSPRGSSGSSRSNVSVAAPQADAMTVTMPDGSQIKTEYRYCDPHAYAERRGREPRQQVEFGVQRYTTEPIEPPTGELFVAGGCP